MPELLPQSDIGGIESAALELLGQRRVQVGRQVARVQQHQVGLLARRRVGRVLAELAQRHLNGSLGSGVAACQRAELGQRHLGLLPSLHGGEAAARLGTAQRAGSSVLDARDLLVGAEQVAVVAVVRLQRAALDVLIDAPLAGVHVELGLGQPGLVHAGGVERHGEVLVPHLRGLAQQLAGCVGICDIERGRQCGHVATHGRFEVAGLAEVLQRHVSL